MEIVWSSSKSVWVEWAPQNGSEYKLWIMPILTVIDRALLQWDCLSHWSGAHLAIHTIPVVVFHIHRHSVGNVQGSSLLPPAMLNEDR